MTTLKTIQAVSALLADLPALKDTRPSAWVQRLAEIPPAAIYAAYISSREPALRRYAAEWRHIRPTADGETLKALGLPPGPRYAQILTALRAAWLDGDVISLEQEAAFVEKLAKEYGQ